MSTARSWIRRPAPLGLALTAAFVAGWVVLAALRPTVTYHLAPALVALTLPYAYWTRSQPLTLPAAILSAVAGGTIAVLTTLGLGSAGYLAGPVLFGADATVEGLIVAGSAAVTAAAIGTLLVLLRSRRGGTIKDKPAR